MAAQATRAQNDRKYRSSATNFTAYAEAIWLLERAHVSCGILQLSANKFQAIVAKEHLIAHEHSRRAKDTPLDRFSSRLIKGIIRC